MSEQTPSVSRRGTQVWIALPTDRERQLIELLTTEERKRALVAQGVRKAQAILADKSPA